MIITPAQRLWIPTDGNCNDVVQGLTLTDTNVIYADGVIGKAAIFGASGAKSEVSDIIDNSSQGTICMRVTPLLLTVNYCLASFTRDTTAAYLAFYIISGKLCIQSFTTGGNVHLGTTSIPTSATHIAFVSTGTAYLLYVNGVLDPRLNATYDNGDWLSDNPSRDRFTLGAYRSPAGVYSSFMNGGIEDVQLYNIALPISDIKRIRDGLHPLTKG